MHDTRELVALVALTRYGSYQRQQMALRQRLIVGDTLSKILEDEVNPKRLCAKARDDVNRWVAADKRPLCWLDDDYPQHLREVHDFPLVIFTRGALIPADRGLCVVGSRGADADQIAVARQMARLIVEAGLTVVSGLDRGIDTAAHSEALNLGGRTVAVIGTGIDRYYPRENRQLQDRIARCGMLLSQFWPGAGPTRYSFPMRNAVMSGYAKGTIIVTANEKSGTRHQAKQAAAHGRPLVVLRSVYENTTWARKFVDDPTVLATVADTAQEAVTQAFEMAELTLSDLVLS